jgi:ADP-ribosylglycohydrolase/tetratricopeptide (TPR) repeat protein
MATVQVFISYRRDPDEAVARLVVKSIEGGFVSSADGIGVEIYFDVQERAGVNWPDRIRESLRAADIVVAVMGPGWLGATDQYHRRRIDQDDDWVRQELEFALAHDKVVIPLLFDGAVMPPASALPESLRALPSRQGVVVRTSSFDSDVQPLLGAIIHHGRGYDLMSAAGAIDAGWPYPPTAVGEPRLSVGLSSGGRTAAGTTNVPRRPRIWNVLREHKPSFTGRDTVLKDLRTRLTAGNPDAAIQAIHGLGGVGKTQVAAEYAHRYRDEYDVVWWIRTVKEQLTPATDFAALARALDLPERDLPDQAVIIDAVRHWLGHHDRWLLIFDDAHDYPEIRPYLPPLRAGHVLITSRNQVWGGRVQRVSLPILALEDAAGFLLTRTESTEEAAALQLATALGRLPLALEQAAAYVESTAISLANYLERFQTRLESLWAVEQPPDDYPTTVDATWALAMDELRAATPAAADLLAVLAFVAADPLDRAVLETSADHLPETLARTIADPIELDQLMGAFRRFSLIEVTKDHLLVHALVQHVTRMRLGDDGRRAWAGTAVRLTNAAFPFDSEDVVTWPQCEQLLPHALATVGHAERLGVEREATSRLLNQMGHYLFARGDVAEAAKQVTRALGNGEDTTDIDALIFLGNIHLYSGDFAKATAYATRALEVAREHGSTKHQARCLIVFGACLMHSGDLPGAEESFRGGISLLERLPPAERDNKVYSELLGNLGSVEEIRGHWDDAERLHGMALRRRIENGHAVGVLETALALGRVALGRGALPLAHERLADALRRAEDLDEKLQQAKIIHQRGELAFRMDEVNAAVDLVQDARRRFKECGTPYDVTQTELSLARMLAGSRPWESVELLAAARAKVERQGFALLRQLYPELDPPLADRIQAGLLAYAAGDAFGLPWEDRPRREVRMAELEHLPATDMWPSGSTSDDTALTLLVADHLARAEGLGEPIEFLAKLSEQSPRIPGLGPSTTRAIRHFTATGSPDDSGSDTNGAPMRALPVGWAVPASDDPKRRAWTKALTRVTHTGNAAITAACVMSACAAWAIEGAQPPLLTEIAKMEAAVVGPDTKVARTVDAVREDSWQPPVDGITSDPAETVAAVLYCCRTTDGLATALRRAVSLGGDTDTVAALVGGVLGCQLSPAAVSEQLTWLDRVLLPARDHLATLAKSLATMRLAGDG